MKLTNVEMWSMAAGGTSAAEGKYSYDLRLPNLGLFMINPVSWPNGRHRGYTLSVANIYGKLSGGLYWLIVDVNGTHSFHRQTIFSPMRLAFQAAEAFRQKFAHYIEEVEQTDVLTP